MQAQAQTQTAAPAAKLVLADLGPSAAQDAAARLVKGVKQVEAARFAMLVALTDACEIINVPLTAAQYDRQVAPAIRDAFKAAAARKGSPISERTAAQYVGKLKTAVLAVLSGAAQPKAGETFWDFYDRAAQALPSAKLADGSPVWEVSKKAGRPVGFKAPAKPGSVKPGAAHAADVAGAAPLSEEAQGSAKLAAARILANGNDARARRLVLALSNYAEQFDKWMSSVLEAEASKPTAGKLPPAPEPIVLKDGEPATALAAALTKAEGRKRRAA